MYFVIICNSRTLRSVQRQVSNIEKKKDKYRSPYRTSEPHLHHHPQQQQRRHHEDDELQIQSRLLLAPAQYSSLETQ